ncbi:MAG: RDD family protein [Pseudomonadales bacterium]
MPPAGLLRRLGAMIYDALLVIALWMTTIYILVLIADRAVIGAAVQTLLFLELYGFFVFFWLTRGQTLGMLAWHLAIVPDQGGPLTLRQVTIRFFVAIPAFLCAGLGYLWILFRRDRRGWSDLASGTHVVRLPST